MAFTGVGLSGFSVGLFKMSLFGTDPFQCLVGGIWNVSHISFGILYMFINLILLVGIFFIGRHYIGIATFMNIFGTGYIVQFTTQYLSRYFSEAAFSTRIILLITGIVIMCFASSLYYTADLGVSTYDAVALLLSDKRSWSFRYCRISTDFICIFTGVLLHAPAGLGTIVTAFFMGPLIEVFKVHAAEPFLYHKK